MTRESSKENKPAGFKTLINVLRPIRDWLKNTPTMIHAPTERSSVTSSKNSSNNMRGSSATINSTSKSAIVHTNHLLGNGTVEYNTHLMRQQQQQCHQQQQQLYSQPIYRRSQLSLALPPPPPPMPRPAPIIGNHHGPSMTPNHYYSTTPVSVLNSNTSSTPISNHNGNNNNNTSNNNSSTYRDDTSSFMMASATLNMPNTNGNIGVNGTMMTMDDLNGSTLSRVDEHFKRTAKSRMSLPIMQQNKLRRQAYSQLQKRGQRQPQSLGHIYLQHKGETKQANLPNELTAIDTIRALFVCAFPNMLSMEYMSQPHVKIYIYNPSCNIFYELRDIDDVRHESVLRIHQSDPLLALSPPQYQAHMTLPPPKPRRMIPVNGMQHNSMIYGITTHNNQTLNGAPMTFQPLPQIQASPERLQTMNSQASLQQLQTNNNSQATLPVSQMARQSMLLPQMAAINQAQQTYQTYQLPNQVQQQQQQQQQHQHQHQHQHQQLQHQMQLSSLRNHYE